MSQFQSAVVTGLVAEDSVQLLYNNADYIIRNFFFFSFKQATQYVSVTI